MVGKSYEVALRLCVIAEAHYSEIDARYPSTNLIRLPFNQFCNYVYAWLVSLAQNSEQREEMDVQLAAPLPTARVRRRGKGVRELKAAPSEIDQFRAVAAEIGVG